MLVGEQITLLSGLAAEVAREHEVVAAAEIAADRVGLDEQVLDRDRRVAVNAVVLAVDEARVPVAEVDGRVCGADAKIAELGAVCIGEACDQRARARECRVVAFETRLRELIADVARVPPLEYVYDAPSCSGNFGVGSR